MNDHERHDRNIKIVCDVLENQTMVKVAAKYGVSAARVKQICEQYLRRTKLLTPGDVNVTNGRKDKDRLIESIKKLTIK